MFNSSLKHSFKSLPIEITYNAHILQEVIPKWGKSWIIKVSFEIVKPPSAVWTSIFHFIKKERDFERLPSFFYRNGHDQLQIVLCQDPTNKDTCDDVAFSPYGYNTKYDVEITHKNEGSGYKWSIYSNGARVVHLESAGTPGVFDNV